MLESLDLPLGAVLGTFGVERSPDHLARPGRARRLDADGPAARRARRRGQAGAGAPRDRRARSATGRCAPRAASSASPGSSPRSSRPPSSCSTSATSTRRSSRRCSSGRARRAERFAAEEDIEVEWERIWQIEPILFDEHADRASPTRRSARSPGTSHRLPSGPAARRGRGRARRRADRDAVRPEPARPLAHEARGHEARSTSSCRCGRSTGWRRRRSPGSPRADASRALRPRRAAARLRQGRVAGCSRAPGVDSSEPSFLHAVLAGRAAATRSAAP